MSVTKAGISFLLKNKSAMIQSHDINKNCTKSNVVFLLFVLLFIIAQSCENLEVVRVVKIETGDLYEVSKNSASITGNIMDIGEDAIAQHLGAGYSRLS